MEVSNPASVTGRESLAAERERENGKKNFSTNFKIASKQVIKTVFSKNRSNFYRTMF
jgi:hypothetical protein